MRSYCIDEISPEAAELLKEYLEKMNLNSSLEGVYWLDVPEKYYSEQQKAHKGECTPFCMALILEGNSIHLELLVRALGRMHCNCMGYASNVLREHMISWLEDCLKNLGINI